MDVEEAYWMEKWRSVITCGVKDQTRMWKTMIESGGKDFNVEGPGSVFWTVMWIRKWKNDDYMWNERSNEKVEGKD